MRKIIINEKQEKKLKDAILKNYSCHHYPVNPEQVLIIKNFLDKTFDKAKYEDKGEDGLPVVQQIVIMKGPSGNPMDSMFMDDLQSLLIHKFSNMFTDEDQKSKFFSQVMKDWYDDKIGLFGNLSVNYI